MNCLNIRDALHKNKLIIIYYEKYTHYFFMKDELIHSYTKDNCNNHQSNFEPESISIIIPIIMNSYYNGYKVEIK